ncbi:MAG TPA: hypothetical protein VIA62_09395 [Thermoanaerobaculia bacterium]|jgi:hypothetical protein|nr:hypothetical protein [Thermoanaerobaculia bacterium]
MSSAKLCGLGWALAIGIGLSLPSEAASAAPAKSPKGPNVQFLSLSDFNSAQDAYCKALAESLNQPIDWHIVLDISGSYKDKDKNALDTVVHLIHSLPLQDKDTLRFDTFGEGYSEGTGPKYVDFSWIQALQASESRSNGEIETWLLPALKQAPVQRGHTNLQALIGLLGRSEHRDCPKALRYYVVLTDGINEPPESRGFVPLFGKDKTSSFLQDALNFVAPPSKGSEIPARGLAFVIDQRFTKNTKLKELVHADWVEGRRRMRDGVGPKVSDLRPQATIWHSPTDEGVFEDRNSLALARDPGIFPCLISNSGPDLPTATGKAYPSTTELGITGALPPNNTGDYSLILPDDVLNGTDEEVPLNLALLSRGKIDGALLVSVRKKIDNLEPNLWPIIYSERFPIYGVSNPAAGWAIQTQKIKIPISETRLANYPPAWIADFSLEGKKGIRHFLDINLDAPLGVSESASLFWRDMCKFGGIRGRFFAGASLLACVVGMILMWFRHRALLMSVSITGDGISPATAPQESFMRIYHHRHIRNKIGRSRFRRVLREDGPTLSEEAGEVELDVIPIFGMVYHVANFVDSRSRILDSNIAKKGPRFSQTSFKGKKNMFAFFFKPQTFWRFKRTDRGAPSYIWEQPVKVPKEVEGDNSEFWTEGNLGSLRVITTIEETRLSLLGSAAIALIMSVAFAFAAIALIQSMSLRRMDFLPLSGEWQVALLIPLVYWIVVSVCSGCGVWLKFCMWLRHVMSLFIFAVLVMGMLFPFIPNGTARFLIEVVVIGDCVVIALLCNEMLKRRISNQEPLNSWEMACEWFLRVSPILL